MKFIFVARGLLSDSIGYKRTRMLAKNLVQLGYEVLYIVPGIDPFFINFTKIYGQVLPVKCQRVFILEWILKVYNKMLKKMNHAEVVSKIEKKITKREKGYLRGCIIKKIKKEAYVQFQCGNYYLVKERVYRLSYKSYTHLMLNNDYIKSFIETDRVVLFTSVSPGYLNIVGGKLKRKYPQLFWIADYRDPIENNHNFKEYSFSKRISKCNEYAFANADMITGVSAGLVKKLTESAGNQGLDITNRTIILYNGFERVENDTFIMSKKVDKFEILYTGTLYENQNIEMFLDVLSTCGFSKWYSFSYAGTSANRISRYLRNSEKNPSINDYGSLPYREALKLQQNADILLLLKNEDNEQGILTGKLYEYIFTDKMIIVLGDRDREFNELVEKIGGIYVLPYNEECIREFLKEIILKKDITVNRNAEEIKKYSWKNLTLSFVEKISEKY